ncbi:MAG: hypothetical protein GAK28_00513 [Luteibacter sp.]|uniref:FUSC family protein n=1 Tax=Luteibacter sp. TaxID=1886636 RepID=UPI00137E3FF5|nr:FUSC family protein [Luteibacter sp.]KAF1008881.1 MAG: hypothetical protein GAK28_00513 [Luteibacter sp.]
MSPIKSLSVVHRAHIAEVFRWSDDVALGWRRVLLAFVAMTVPIVTGQWADKPALGYLVGLGAMLMAGESHGSASEPSSVWLTWLPVVLSVTVASLVAQLPFADVLMIALIVPASTLVNYSRPAAVAGIRFIVLLVLNMGLVGGHGAHGRGAALMFGVGAIWRLLLRVVMRRERPLAEKSVPSGREPTHRQRRAHLGRALRSLQGWQYPIRLVGGLAAACLIRNLWPKHHFAWIVLSIVLLTPRALERLLVHITQRAIGTFLGVALTGALLAWGPGHLATAIVVCVFGTAAPLLRTGNYGLYCIFSTPIILVAMSANAPVGAMLLEDRLTATLMAAAIVVTANLLMDAVLRRQVRAESP